MNVGQLLRDSWRITWQNWPLWALNLLMFIAIVPVFSLTVAFGGAAALISTPLPAGVPLPFARSLQGMPGWLWLVVTIVALAFLVGTSAVTWTLQAAAMRGAGLAAEHGTFTFGQAIQLGRQRATSILKLSVTFGVLIAALGLLPPVGLILLRDVPLGTALVNLAQTGLVPFNIALSLTILLVMMSVALEDLAPRAALRRAWQVFRSGWWGFLIVFAISALPGFVVALLIVVPMAILVPVLILSPEVGVWLAPGVCAVTGPIGLVVVLFVAVFTVAMYTLTFRAAAKRLEASTS